MGDIIEISFMLKVGKELVAYIPVTLGLAVSSLFFASFIGIFGAAGQLYGGKALQRLIALFVLLGRSVPTMIMLYLVYFALPLFLLALHEEWGLGLGMEKVPAWLLAVLALTLHTGAYLVEIFRSAFLSVPKGQTEAALACGMNLWTAYRRIIFPQAAVYAVPLLANQFLGLIKGTSIVFVITVVEIFGAAKIACADTYRYLETYLAAAIIYWAMSICFEILFNRAENYFGRFKRGRTI